VTLKTLEKIVAAQLFLVVFAVYMMTVAPTISFWDTGEFIACATSMGIPHPPGAPLLSIVGRVMSIIPFYDYRGGGFEHIAYRINLISLITGTLTIVLFYFIILRLLKKFVPSDLNARQGWPFPLGAAVASFLAAFSHQFWENAIETETYMPSLFLSILALWLVLKWEERKDTPSAVRFLFLAAYLIGLGIGVHLYVMLMVPTLALIVYFAKAEWFSDWRLWGSAFIMLASFALARTLGGKLIFTMLMGLSALAGPYLLHRLYTKEAARWKLTLIGILACVSLFTVGYSVYPSIMVRASKSPSINEGNPDNFARFRDYLERKQYLRENMYTGMFGRKADTGYQFGFMYARYLLEQFPIFGPTATVTFTNDRSADYPGQQVDIRHEVHVSVLLWLIILFGIGYHVVKDRRRFMALFLYFLLTSIGLVLYLNMANPEVRERDYFFLGSFLIIYVWFGIGIFGLLDTLKTFLGPRVPGRVKFLIMVAAAHVFGLIVPASLHSHHIDPSYSQFQSHDRSGDLIPFEYGKNILASCEPDAILFTHGDNDTFPVWYAQESLGLRKDVRVVNVSLLNAPWYTTQLRDEGVKLPIELTDDYLAENIFGNSQAAEHTLRWTPEPKPMTMAGISWEMPPSYTYPRPDGTQAAYLSASAWMTAYIINQVNWDRPIYFAVTMSPAALIGLEPYLMMEGMVFRLTQENIEGGGHAVARETLEKNIFERYSYSGIADPDVYKSPETARLIQNYFVGFGELVKQYIISGEKDRALEVAEKALAESSPDLDHRMALYAILQDGGLANQAADYVESELAEIDYASFHNALKSGMTLIQYGFYVSAVDLFKTLTEVHPDNITGLKAYSASLYGAERFNDCLAVIEQILTKAPNDKEALMYKNVIIQRLNGSGS